jgi:hypothetical protein
MKTLQPNIHLENGAIGTPDSDNTWLENETRFGTVRE